MTNNSTLASLLSGSSTSRRRSRRNDLADLLMKQGADTSPIQHPLQGVARLAQAWAGNRLSDKIDQEGRDQYSHTLAAMLGDEQVNPLAVTGRGATPEQRQAVQDTPATSFQGGIIPDAQAQTYAKLLQGLDPEVGNPVVGQLLAQQLKGADPKDRYMSVGGSLADLMDPNGPKFITPPQKPEATPDLIQMAQYLFPDNPEKQRNYIRQNSPANLRSVREPPVATVGRDFLLPILQKIQRGETLTQGEKVALETYQRTSALDRIINGINDRLPAPSSVSPAPEAPYQPPKRPPLESFNR